MKKIGKLFIGCILIIGLMSTAAFAAFPEGQWTATFYSEVFGGSGTQGICIQAGGTWYSDTFAGWSGYWYRKGNDIHLHGNYAAGAGNDAWELTRISNNLLTGYWQEWSDDGLFNNYLTTRFNFASATCNPLPAAQAAPQTNNPSEGQ